MSLRLSRQHVLPFLDADARAALDRAVFDAHRRVVNGTTRSPEMLGWRALLLPPDEALLDRVAALAEEIRREADVLLCIGIGGSYLGAEAVMQALSPYFGRSGPEVLFAGHHLSPAYHAELLDYLRDRRVYVNVISKSGTTLEPALAFRFARRLVETQTDTPARRIVATTDAAHGTLRVLAEREGYRTFVIPDSVGGRFSVLTPVGLLPIAVAGGDVHALVRGAAEEAAALGDDVTAGHPALQYAADRFALHEQGYKTELLAVMEPRLRGLGAWWQQLFGESEGKDGKGLFPSVVQYTTDLHSVGQYVQEGQRVLAELFLRVDDAGEGLTIPESDDDGDGLNYLAGKPYGFVNLNAYQGTAEAHAEGGVPSWTLTLPRLDADAVGRALYFFMHAVAVSGTLLGVDPFDQPGVEAYKQKMFALLGKPGA